MQRIKSLDLARGFTVSMIAPIHTMLLCSRPDAQDSLLANCLALIAEGPGAQLFMLLMGIYIAFQQPATLPHMLKRAINLLLAGYGLNLLKFVLPLGLGLMPPAMQTDLQVEQDPAGIWQVFLLGDILQFAALALPLLWLLRRLAAYQYISLGAAMMICFIAPFCWDAQGSGPCWNYILQLTGGQPPRVFFPLLPWLVYPLAGLAIGYWFSQNNPGFFPRLRNAGVILLAAGFAIAVLFPGPATSFYRTYPAATLEHLGIVLLTIYLWEMLSRYIPPNACFRFLAYMSRNITQVYFIQWLVICWLLPFFGYQELNLLRSIGAITTTSFLTLFISATVNAFRKGRP